MVEKSFLFHRRLDYDYPVITHGDGIYLYDEKGKRYIDAAGGAIVAILGHGQHQIAHEISKYASKISYLHGSQFTTRVMEEYAHELIEIAPANLKKVFFVSGGSEATETAIKLTHQYFHNIGKPNKNKFVYRSPSYHGSTLGALSLTGKKGSREIYEPLLIQFPSIPAPICYRCPYGEIRNKCRLKCAYALEEKVIQENPDTVAAFIAEPVIGASAGAVPPPEGYFTVIRSICDKYGMLLILDEIMCGFGRTGKWFASQFWDVEADILYIGKGISAGIVPLAALFCTEKIFDTIRRNGGNFTHGFTYTNNPLSTAVGKLVLNHVIQNNLIDNIRSQSAYFFSRLEELYAFETVGDIRGKGFLIGIEFVKDKKSKEPFPRNYKLSEKLVTSAMNNGLNLYYSIGFSKDGKGDAIMMGPPYNIGKHEIDQIITILIETISEMQESL